MHPEIYAFDVGGSTMRRKLFYLLVDVLMLLISGGVLVAGQSIPKKGGKYKVFYCVCEKNQ